MFQSTTALTTSPSAQRLGRKPEVGHLHVGMPFQERPVPLRSVGDPHIMGVGTLRLGTVDLGFHLAQELGFAILRGRRQGDRTLSLALRIVGGGRPLELWAGIAPIIVLVECRRCHRIGDVLDQAAGHHPVMVLLAVLLKPGRTEHGVLVGNDLGEPGSETDDDPGVPVERPRKGTQAGQTTKRNKGRPDFTVLTINGRVRIWRRRCHLPGEWTTPPLDMWVHVIQHDGYEAAWRRRSEWREGLRQGRPAAGRLVSFVSEQRAMIRYPESEAKGWQIGSGPTEATCKMLTARLQGSGMHWNADNAEAIMALETLSHRGQWVQYRQCKCDRRGDARNPGQTRRIWRIEAGRIGFARGSRLVVISISR